MSDDKGRLPTAVRLGWVSFFQDFGSKMLVPVMPLFLTSVLGAPPIAVALSDGIGDATAAVTKSWSGRLADRRAALPLVRLGYALSTIAKAITGLVGAWVLAIVLRAVDRVGKGVRDAPRDLLLAADVARSGRGFGVQQAMDKAGGCIGPLVGVAALAVLDQNLRSVFVVAAVPCAISVAIVMWLRDPDDRRRPTDNVSPKVSRRELRPAYQSTAMPVLAVALRVPEGLLVVRLLQLGASASAVLVSYSVLRFVAAVVSYPAGALADRVDPRRIIAAACALAVLMLVVLSRSSLTLALCAFPVAGAVDALSRAPLKRWVASVVPKDRRGALLGDTQAASGIISLLVGIVAGLLWTRHASGVMLTGAALSAAAAIALMVIGRGALSSSAAG
jgi:sugar phosphate permease